jgi:DNA polymerase elongation subunit (family B)
VYVDSIIDKNKDIISVVERVDGVRKYIQYPARYVFYYPDANGKFTSIFGDKLNRVQHTSSKQFNKEKKMQYGKKLFESDVNPVFRCLSENYENAEAPELNTAFWDIETDFNKELGFAPPEDPFNAVTAISVHLSWMKRTFCLAVAPKKIDASTANDIADKFEDTIICATEEEMLLMFLDLIDDADVFSGWNSEGFDIPYTVNRVAKILGKEYTRRFCLWDHYPKKRMFEKYGKEQETYDTVGRVHLDYLQLYQKYTYHEMHSYSLDAIAEYELGEKKVEYEGTLDQLYNNDFEKFISYSRQDVDLLVRLDKKLQFIDLANVLAHANTVLLQTTMGAVAQTDQAIINEAHGLGLIVPDKRRHTDNIPAAGAYVAVPEKGMHKWIASMDLNSLYPSILRSCNMSTETIVGQIRHTLTDQGIMEQIAKVKNFDKKVADPTDRDEVMAFGKSMLDSPFPKYWEGKFAAKEYELVMERDTDTLLTVDMEDGSTMNATGAEIYDIVFTGGMPWVLSSNGTIFSYEKKGVIPGLLERWYSERKVLQKKAKGFRAEGNAEQFAFWDKRQLVKKINLNSLYGALLNPGSRFFDSRLGQSTTLTGRCIARHMAGSVNQVMTGEYDYKGDTIIYGDTDSVYFSAYPMLKEQIDAGELKWDKDSIIAYYDAVSEAADETFPGYMNQAHNCPADLGRIIAAGREIVGQSGLFIIKKRYAILVIDDEGQRMDVDGKSGKLKAMGLDLKRSDTPAFMQDWLKEILDLTLNASGEEPVLERIKEIRKEFRSMKAWKKGTPKRVNKLSYYAGLEWKVNKRTGEETFKGKANMPGHVRAAINYNRLRKMYGDAYSMEIEDGMKTIVCKLKDNPLKMKSIGIPTDLKRVPEWFQDLPFDDKEMEQAIVTKKIENLLGVLNWDLQSAHEATTFNSLFDFD